MTFVPNLSGSAHLISPAGTVTSVKMNIYTGKVDFYQVRNQDLKSTRRASNMHEFFLTLEFRNSQSLTK